MQKKLTTKQTEEGVWTKQEKKNYIKFIIRNMPNLNEKAPRFFYNKMASTISNIKTPQQCIDFHHYRKNMCKNLEELVKKVAAQIDQDPSLFNLQSEKNKMIEMSKKDFFKDLKINKSIQKDVLQRFMTDFNPYEIIFKPDQVLESQKITNSKQTNSIRDWNQLFCRPLQSKLYPIKDQGGDYQDEHKDQYLDNQDKMIDENEQRISAQTKKKLLLQKNQKKTYKKTIKMAQSGLSWSKSQSLKLLVFLMYFKNYLSKQDLREKYGIFPKMSSFIGTRGTNSCSSYVESLQKKYESIEEIIDYLQTSIDFRKEEVWEELQNIQDFYQDHLKNQCNALNPVRLSLCYFGDKNEKLIQTIVKQKPEINQLEKMITANAIQMESYMPITRNQNIEFQLPITMVVYLIKQEKFVSKDIVKKQRQEENNDFCNKIETYILIGKPRKEQTRLKKKTKKSLWGVQENDFKDQKIKCSQNSSAPSKKYQRWSVSENIKFATYSMVNRRFFGDIQLKDKQGIFVKLSKFLQTGKDEIQCSYHFIRWKNNYDNDPKKTIDGQAKRFGITASMIEERKEICMQVQTLRFKIGTETLEIDHLPQKIYVKRGNFCQEAVVSQIYKAEPYLSFYLTSERTQLKQENDYEKNEKDYCEEKCENEEISNQSEITTIVKLGIDEQRFEKLKKGIQKKLSGGKSWVQSCTEEKIKIKVKTKQIYKLIVSD